MTGGCIVGVNFSHRRAAALGLDPDETFSALINDLRVRCFRLSLYWCDIQPEPTRYDFESVHRYLDLAERRGARVLMTVGLRAPREPWEYPPDWLAPADAALDLSRPAFRPRVVAHLLLMLERSVSLLADYSAIDAWQIEVAAPPEADLLSDPATLLKEYAAVAGCDPRNRPLVASSAGRSLLELAAPGAMAHADVLGQEIYPRPAGFGGGNAAARPLGTGIGLGARVALTRLRGRRFWLTSLPAEPAGDNIAGSHSGGLCSPEPGQVQRSVRRAARLGAERVYLSGGEWWQQRRFCGDGEYWESARRLFEQEQG